MTSSNLDRSRPFGQIIGEEDLGRFFEQDGRIFDRNGEPWRERSPAQPVAVEPNIVSPKPRVIILRTKDPRAKRRAWHALRERRVDA